jgi:outer membrane receptor protein involved in Fe transport
MQGETGRVSAGVIYHWPDVWRLQGGFVGVRGGFVDRQRRFDADTDFAPPPPPYGLLGASTGIELPISRQVLALSVEGNNLTNTPYRDYTSLLRYSRPAEPPASGVRPPSSWRHRTLAR